MVIFSPLPESGLPMLKVAVCSSATLLTIDKSIPKLGVS
jgi:hypothetical protein